MEITEVRIFLRNEDKLKAYATITFDNAFVVRNLKVVQGQQGLFVAMPSRKMSDGSYKDVAHPVNNEMRNKIEKKVLEAYNTKAGETAGSEGSIVGSKFGEFGDSETPVE
ncbi:MAG: septation regulator SpoVG [Elusimicrobiota bacterium]